MTAAGFARAANLLDERGHPVNRVDGWQRRGRGTLTPRGLICHHTAGGRHGDTPSLRVVTHGRAGLRNALSNWYVSRTGDVYLVAANTAWHAGRGVKGSNSTLVGIEAEHSGSDDEPWRARSLAAQAAICLATAEVFGYPLSATWEHKEHAPRRKIDRISIDGDAWRDRLASGFDEQDDDMIFEEGSSGSEVRLIQVRLNQVFGGEPVTVDGDFGPQTRDFVAEYQKRDNYLTPTGKVDWFTFVKLTNDAHGAVVSH